MTAHAPCTHTGHRAGPTAYEAAARGPPKRGPFPRPPRQAQQPATHTHRARVLSRGCLGSRPPLRFGRWPGYLRFFLTAGVWPPVRAVRLPICNRSRPCPPSRPATLAPSPSASAPRGPRRPACSLPKRRSAAFPAVGAPLRSRSGLPPPEGPQGTPASPLHHKPPRRAARGEAPQPYRAARVVPTRSWGSRDAPEPIHSRGSFASPSRLPRGDFVSHPVWGLQSPKGRK